MQFLRVVFAVLVAVYQRELMPVGHVLFAGNRRGVSGALVARIAVA